MESPRLPARFGVDPGANDSDLGELFERIATYSLAHNGWPEGFRLAWVAARRETFDALVQTEYPRMRAGITARAFFDEASAQKWLS